MIPFTGIAAIEDKPTGDGRMLAANSVTFDAPPYPLKFVPTGGHDGIVVGTVTDVWRDKNAIRYSGHLHDDSEDSTVRQYVTRIGELAAEGLAGVSVGLDDEDVEIRVKKSLLEYDPSEPIDADDLPEDSEGRVIVAKWASGDELTVITSARLREVTVTDQPAIVGTGIEVTPAVTEAIAASNRKSAFANPNFGPDGDHDPRLVWQKPLRPDETGGWGCPLTIEDDGTLYGHLAINSRCHGAFQACVTAPDSGNDFSAFLTGEAERGIPTGPIILGTTHSVNPDGTVKSYDHLADTGQAVADVTVGRDMHGIWVAGRLRPGITEAQLAALKGSALSGEWLPYGTNLRLAGILAVNSPGYLITRKSSVVASNGRSVEALYTVGPTCCGEDPTEARLRILETALVASLTRGILT